MIFTHLWSILYLSIYLIINLSFPQHPQTPIYNQINTSHCKKKAIYKKS